MLRLYSPHPKLFYQSALIYLLQKARTEDIAYLIDSADYTPDQFIHRFTFIYVHLRLISYALGWAAR